MELYFELRTISFRMENHFFHMYAVSVTYTCYSYMNSSNTCTRTLFVCCLIYGPYLYDFHNIEFHYIIFTSIKIIIFLFHLFLNSYQYLILSEILFHTLVVSFSEVLPKKITMAEYYKLVGKESSEDGEDNSSQTSHSSSSSVSSEN